MDNLTMQILLARCLGTLEGLYSVLKLPPGAEKQVLDLIKDLKKVVEND